MPSEEELYGHIKPIEAHPCNCTGPQNGEPVCPCQMRSVTIRNGRYYRETDLGPAMDPADRARLQERIAALNAQLVGQMTRDKEAYKDGEGPSESVLRESSLGVRVLAVAKGPAERYTLLDPDETVNGLAGDDRFDPK